MRNVLLVTRRELRLQLRSRAFLITVLSGVLAIAGLIVVPPLISGDDKQSVAVVGDASLTPTLEALAQRSGRVIEVRTGLDESSARAQVADGDLDLAVVDARTVVSEDLPDQELVALVQQAHEISTVESRLSETALPENQVRDVISVVPLESEVLDDDAADESARQLVAVLVLVALLFLLMTTTVSVASGVVEEKGSRIVEILLVAMPARDVLAGKLLSFGVLGLVQLAAFSIAALASVAAVGLGDDLPPGTAGVIATTFTGYVFGFLFFGAMSAALASRISRQEDLNSTLGPMTAAMMFTYLGAFVALNSPDSVVSRLATLLPPFSSMVVPVRMSTGSVAGWEVAVSMVLMVAAIVAIMLAAGRIYERSVLRTGSKGRILDALRPREHADADPDPDADAGASDRPIVTKGASR